MRSRVEIYKPGRGSSPPYAQLPRGMAMIEKHEEHVLTTINQMTQVMGDHSYVSAYPALHGMFVSMRMGLDAL